jgi:hypothetical protein
MKRFCIILSASLFCLASATAADGRLGVGVVVGEPTGVSVEYRLDKDNSVQGSAAWDLTSPGGFTLTGDYLFLLAKPFKVEKYRFPLYAGIGGKLVALAGDGSFGDSDGKLSLGARVPLGARWQFDGMPLEAFLEIAPCLRLVPNTAFELGGGLGLRWYFDVK